MVRRDLRHLRLFSVASWSHSGFFFIHSKIVDLTLFSPKMEAFQF